MDNWLSILSFNPVDRLLSSSDEVLTYFVLRDILDEPCDKKQFSNTEIKNIKKKQQANGSWIFKSQSRRKYPSINHDLIETFKSIRILVGKYEMDKSDSTVSKCADYIFSCQTNEGDFRGILGNQYMPYYCGLLLEFLIKSGYVDDPRIHKAFEWLINIRQNNGGWVIPLQTVKIDKLNDTTYASKPIVADKTLPFSHMCTGMVLRAFAAHPEYKKSEVAFKAAELLKSRFFKPDKYNDRKAPGYWVKLQYPYWWTTLLSSLDSLNLFGFTMGDKDVEKAVEWFLFNQEKSGLWQTKFNKGDKNKVELNALWISYDICRILKKYLK